MLPDKLYGLTVTVSLTASVLQAFAITLQRRSHIFNDAEPPELQRSAFRRPMWVTGFLVYTIANIIGSIFTIGYLPIVVLAPVGAMNLVFNAIFAKVMLGDAFTKRTAYGKLDLQPLPFRPHSPIFWSHIFICFPFHALRDVVDRDRCGTNRWLRGRSGTKSYFGRLDPVVQATDFYCLFRGGGILYCGRPCFYSYRRTQTQKHANVTFRTNHHVTSKYKVALGYQVCILFGIKSLLSLVGS